MKPEENPIIKLVTIDIDGTLINDDMKVPEKNIKAINKAVSNGTNIVICSGRIGVSVRKIMDSIGLKAIVPSLGGTMLTTWDGNVINDYGIDCPIAIDVYNLGRKYGVYPYIFKREHWYSSPENTFWNNREVVLTGVAGVMVEPVEFLSKNSPNKFVFPSFDKDIIAGLEAEIKEKYGDRVEVFLSSPFYIEVLPKGINKGTAVNDLIKYFKITKENVLSIGDYYNDIDMFNAAGNKATVLNAPDDIKAIVDYVSPVDNNNGAVAEVLKAYGIVND